MGIWSVEIRGTITRDIKHVTVDAASMGEAMTKAVDQHPSYRAKTAREMEVPGEELLYIILARIVAVAHGLEAFTEGQLVNITAMDRIDIRVLINEGREHIKRSPLSGENGKHIMKQMGLE